MSLDYVRLMVGVDNDQVTAVYDAMIERLLNKLRPLELTEVPTALEHILDEVAIIRFNQIGSEGMSQESVEGRSATYVSDPFDQYNDEIDQYIRDNLGDEKPQGIQVRLL